MTGGPGSARRAFGPRPRQHERLQPGRESLGACQAGRCPPGCCRRIRAGHASAGSREARARGRARLESAPAAAATAALGGAPPGSAASSSPTAARPRRTIACRCRFSDATRRISRRPCSSSPCAGEPGVALVLCSTAPLQLLLCVAFPLSLCIMRDLAATVHVHHRARLFRVCRTSMTPDCSELHAEAWAHIGTCVCMCAPLVSAVCHKLCASQCGGGADGHSRHQRLPP